MYKTLSSVGCSSDQEVVQIVSLHSVPFFCTLTPVLKPYEASLRHTVLLHLMDFRQQNMAVVGHSFNDIHGHDLFNELVKVVDSFIKSAL